MRIIVEFDSMDIEEALGSAVGLELYDGMYNPELKIIDVQKIADEQWRIKANMRCPDTPDWPRTPGRGGTDGES